MRKYRNILLGTALGLALASPVFAQDPDADTVVARVGEAEITLGHMIAMRRNLSERDATLPPEEIFDRILERLIQQTAVEQSQGALTVGQQKRLDNERRSIVASDIVNQMALQVEVTPEALQAAYDARFGDFDPPPEYNASHILVETEEEAQAVIAELQAGADFAELAKLKSTGPSGPGGGSLNWFGLGRMVKPFEDAVVALEPGGISAPVQTQFGWHVIRLNDMRKAGKPTLDEVRPDLEQQVWTDTLTQQVSDLVSQFEVAISDLTNVPPSTLTDYGLIDY